MRISAYWHHYIQGDIDEAERLYRGVIELEGETWLGYTELGWMLQNMRKDAAAAAEAYQRAKDVKQLEEHYRHRILNSVNKGDTRRRLSTKCRSADCSVMFEHTIYS
jgi:hypothetical protein